MQAQAADNHQMTAQQQQQQMLSLQQRVASLEGQASCWRLQDRSEMPESGHVEQPDITQHRMQLLERRMDCLCDAAVRREVRAAVIPSCCPELPQDECSEENNTCALA